MTLIGRCKSCGTIYDVNQFEDCPKCGRYAGSQLDSVDLLELAGTSPPLTQGTITDTVSPNVDRDLTIKEYFQCLSIIDAFDQRALTIKAWSVTASLAGIGAAFTYGKPALFLVSALSAFVFWWLEARWKTFQSVYKSRAKEIEQYLQGRPSVQFRSPAIWESGTQHWHSKGQRRFQSLLFHTHVALPHAFIAVAGLLLWLLHITKSVP